MSTGQQTIATARATVRERTPSRSSTLLRGLLASCFGVVLALVLAELGLRLFRPAVPGQDAPLTYNREAIATIAAGKAYVSFDPTLGWVPTPNYETVADSVRYRHNAAGQRADRDYSPTPPPGIRRLAAYGDSFTYCQEVNADDCWTRQLEQSLPNTEVINFGVPGSAPDMAWLRYQRDGASWQPCAVLIGHFLGDIMRMVNRFRPFHNPDTGVPLAKPRFILQNGRLQLLPIPTSRAEDLEDPAWVEANLGPYDRRYLPGMFTASPLDSLRLVGLARTAVFHTTTISDAHRDPRGADSYEPGTEAYEVLVAVLASFAEQVRADGATPIVVILPADWQIIRQREGQPKTYAPLLRDLKRRGVTAIDLNDALGQEARRTSVKDLAPAHYSPLGNAVVAQTLASQLPRLTADTCGRA